MPFLCSLLAHAAITTGALPPPEATWWPSDLPPRTETPLVETVPQHDARMAWWRESRFGLFIHWGLYAIPGGYWEGRRTGGAEWILNSVKIHPDDYMPLQQQFDPVDFDPMQWVMMAKNAGMKYIVITSKHHDGFCLWPSELTDFDVAGTPFGRDILGELATACRNEGIVLCLYHSIMDWTRPDYLPRRAWDDRPSNDADYQQYVGYMKGQLQELVERYQPAVLWFDGEWEGTWTHEDGQSMYDFVRTIDPAVIVNNRVDTGRTGMAGLTRSGGYRGDFGTPEQEIPATGMPFGVDWETCMTMNRSWGYQSFDVAFKPTKELVRKLVDITSKGGNFLLNVGPDERGRFPEQSIERLAAIGRWMQANDESIHGTFASCFTGLDWGRCTRRNLADQNQRLYLHVFESPTSGVIRLPGLLNDPVERGAFLLANPGAGPLTVEREGADLTIRLPEGMSVEIDTVLVLDIEGPAIVVDAPSIDVAEPIFLESTMLKFSAASDEVEIRYTLDGTTPEFSESSDPGDEPVEIRRSATVMARCFFKGAPVGRVATVTLRRVEPLRAVQTLTSRPGLSWAAYLGSFETVAGLDGLEPAAEGVATSIDLSMQPRSENFGIRFTGFLDAPRTGIYRFSLDSDDGSMLSLGSVVVVDNDGLHSALEKSGVIALEKGLHPLRLDYFEGTGQDDLILKWSGPGFELQPLPAEALKR
jgi:alpha-L-fucosidase